MNYLKSFSTIATPQSEALPGQVANSAGGFSYPVDDWTQMRRFLILGSEGGSYYATEAKLTRDNAQAVQRCIAANGRRAVDEIVTISQEGRAPKNDPAIFALALAASASDADTRSYALSHLGDVCRIGTHLFTFASYVEGFRGWGRGLRSAIGNWYNRPDIAYQLVKYRQRGGWTHADLLRLSHPSHNDLYRWAVGKPVEAELPELIQAYEKAQVAATPKETAALLDEYPNLPREALNPDHLNDIEVWRVLFRNGMPMTALIRNLATMTRVGLIKPLGAITTAVCEQIADAERIRMARVHPLAVLVALKTYEQGYGYRGSTTWTPVQSVIDALNNAFYGAFDNVEPSNKRTLLALDVSGSMDWSVIAGMPGVTPRVGAGAMALVTASVEPSYHIMGFSTELVPIGISPKSRLDDALRTIDSIPMGGTDCALPMVWARERNIEVDTFVVYTDSETWFGSIHPTEALQQYRRASGINAKLIVVGMLANQFSIADPTDGGMLDIVGFDTSAPQVISEFSQT